MLGIQDVKGCLDNDADADLVVLSEDNQSDAGTQLVIDEVWKFGTKIFTR